MLNLVSQDLSQSKFTPPFFFHDVFSSAISEEKHYIIFFFTDAAQKLKFRFKKKKN